MILVFKLLVALFAALTTGGAVLWWAARGRVEPVGPAEPPATEPLTFLFDDEVLQHATDPATSAFNMSPGAHYWGDLREALATRFPDFPDYHETGGAGEITLQAQDMKAPQQATITWKDRLCWITLIDDTPEPDDQTVVTQELATLRRISDTATAPAWEQSAQGQIIWHNQAYATLFEQSHGIPPDPAVPLFPTEALSKSNRAQTKPSGPQEKADWFEISSVPAEDTTIYHATCITAVVDAEETQRNFVQTLAKTFAHLSIGLAIFDRNQQLALFNPALVDLTNLPAQFLSGRPDLLSFFDQLREKRKMPEPKNYHTWREEIAELITAASDGRYEETWTLETGQTYNVKGRPHPDGAIAFLIEDISAEMTLTRSFRAELDQAQTLLDAVTDAIAIFSPAGVLTFSNAAFQTLWQISPDSAFADMTVGDCAFIWKRRARSGADIHAIEAFVSASDPSDTRQMVLRLGDETVFQCEMQPAASGGVMVRFRPTTENDQVNRKRAPQSAR